MRFTGWNFPRRDTVCVEAIIRNTPQFIAMFVFASLLSHALLLASDVQATPIVPQALNHHGDHASVTNMGIYDVVQDTVSGQTLSGDRVVACSVLSPWTIRSQDSDVQAILFSSGLTVSEGIVTTPILYPLDPPGYPPDVLRAFLQVYRN